METVRVSERITFRPDKMSKVNLFDAPQMFCDVYCLEPGQAQAPHTHAETAKVYYVLAGKGVFTIGDEERCLDAGHAVLACEGQVHGVRNVSDGRLILLVFMAPNPNHAR
ncbi:MAG: cupin domain-containing protein [Armatimonadetes bacterium]|nr:cupin domain-containing protein [Armatimonadota bacterium]